MSNYRKIVIIVTTSGILWILMAHIQSRGLTSTGQSQPICRENLLHDEGIRPNMNGIYNMMDIKCKPGEAGIPKQYRLHNSIPINYDPCLKAWMERIVKEKRWVDHEWR